MVRMVATAAADRADFGDPAPGGWVAFSHLYSQQSLPSLPLGAPPPHYGGEGLNGTEWGRGET